MTIENKINELGIILPNPTAPVGSYVATKIIGKLLYISGQISTDEKEYTIGNGDFGEKTLLIKKKLLQIQKEEIDDPFGWIYPLV